MRRIIWLVAVQVALLITPVAMVRAQQPFTFVHPSAGSEGGTYFTAISGNRVAGSWLVNRPIGGSFSGSFLYDLATRTWRDFDYPGARFTEATGIAGNTVVGIYFGPERDLYRSFVYDLTTNAFTPFDHPQAATGAARMETFLTGIEDDGRITGFVRHELMGGATGFVRDAAGNFTDIDYPGAFETTVSDADGARLVGEFDGGHGYLYDGSTWTRIDYPGANRTGPSAIDGDLIVGAYAAGENELYGFIYDIPTASWSSFEYPGARQTTITDIEGNMIVGTYFDGTQSHAFVAFIPEPSLAVPLFVSGVTMASRRRRRVQC